MWAKQKTGKFGPKLISKILDSKLSHYTTNEFVGDGLGIITALEVRGNKSSHNN